MSKVINNKKKHVFKIVQSTHQQLKWILLINTLFIIIDSTTSDVCIPVYITVCSSRKNAGLLELNWNVECDNGADWVGLFEDDPTTWSDPIVKINVSRFSSGFHRTNVPFLFSELPGGWHKELAETSFSIKPGPHCFPYWIASFKNDRILHTNCLKIQPTWMHDNIDQLNNIPLSNLLIPGTHNSGSYNYSAHSNVVWRNIRKFVITQELDVWTQLVHGIRYLDFRIGYYSSVKSFFVRSSQIRDKRFWINHDVIKVTNLVPVLRDVRKFMELTTDEIVVLDIHRLPYGFSENNKILTDRHTILIEILQREFGHMAVDFNEVMSAVSDSENRSTVKDILNTGKRLIICYPEVKHNTTWLWPPLSQKWGNKASTSDLINYIRGVFVDRTASLYSNAKTNPLSAVMAHLTPKNWNVFSRNTLFSVRNLADSVNKNITEWVKFDWWHKANIIATDFFLGNNLIELSIKSIPLKSLSYT
ncbi:PI-PLC X domain-containing protein 2-like [Arctopsyche grandis]|uniref:PI-PLC X domain-containing protein 2-like n=1 Tax=Arctopsyche grandis TaxID=121162 RepID=UPI00406D9C70